MTVESRAEEQIALENLAQVARVERAIDNAYEPIAQSLSVKGKRGVETCIQALKDSIKEYLMDATEPFLYDGEFEWSARLQPRAGTPTYDLVTLSQREGAEDILIEAARAGVLHVDHKALQRFIDTAGASWAETINRMKMPGKGSIALLIGPEQ